MLATYPPSRQGLPSRIPGGAVPPDARDFGLHVLTVRFKALAVRRAGSETGAGRSPEVRAGGVRIGPLVRLRPP